jgi:peptidylprolyl isomerase
VRRIALSLAPALLIGLLAGCSGESDSLPEVSGTYGEKPKVTVAKGSTPSDELETEVLSEGDGPEVKVGDLLVADYLGEVYDSGKVFDNSYDRNAPAAFTLKKGDGGVITGWVDALKGVPVGSRVLLVAPPDAGYGKQGNAQAGIEGDDSLVFVVDLIAAYDKSAPLPKSTPVEDLPANLPSAAGEGKPEITVPADASPPEEPRTTVLATGSGPKAEEGKLTIVQFAAVSWNGEELESTWDQGGPVGVPVGGGTQPSPFDLLAGVPVGSRVLLELPAATGEDAKTGSIAVVIDVLAQHGPAKEAA